MAEDPSNCPEDFPKRASGCMGLGSSVIQLNKLEEEIKECQDKIAEFEDNLKTDGDDEKQKAAFTHIVFVILKKKRHMTTIVRF